MSLLKNAAKKALNSLGYTMMRSNTWTATQHIRTWPVYDHDEMALFNISLDFMKKERFARAYHRGMNTGHRFSKLFGSDTNDIHLEFRVHTILWAADLAARLEGDFVECGVYRHLFDRGLRLHRLQ